MLNHAIDIDIFSPTYPDFPLLQTHTSTPRCSEVALRDRLFAPLATRGPEQRCPRRKEQKPLLPLLPRRTFPVVFLDYRRSHNLVYGVTLRQLTFQYQSYLHHVADLPHSQTRPVPSPAFNLEPESRRHVQPLVNRSNPEMDES